MSDLSHIYIFISYIFGCFCFFAWENYKATTIGADLSAIDMLAADEPEAGE